MVSALAAVWHLLPTRVADTSARGIGKLDLRASKNAHVFLPANWHLASCICCNQSAVTMRISAGLTSAKLTPFPRSSTTGWTTDSEYLFGADFSLHRKEDNAQPFTGMVNFEQFRELLHRRH